MSDDGPGWCPPSPQRQAPWSAPTTRRALLATPFLLATPSQAQPLDESLTRVIRNGVLRVNVGFWTARFVPQPEPGAPPMEDGFHKGMARLLAEGLGVRVDIQDPQQAGDGTSRLLAGEVDLTLAPPITRGLLRTIMFCTPHLTMDLVVVSHARPRRPRGRRGLAGMRLGAISVLANALADREALADLPEPLTAATPYLLAQRLVIGALDGIIVTSATAYSIIGQFPEADLHIQYALANSVFAGAVAYGAHDLLRAINTTLDQLLMNGRLPGLFRQETGLSLNLPLAN